MASRQRRLSGYPLMSTQQMQALQRLRDSKANGYPFASLEGVHGRTVRSMVNYDWILASPGLDGVRYTITGRGLKALKAYEKPIRRFDGMCPDCNENPRKVSQSGRPYGYCKVCQRRHDLKQYHLKGHQYAPDSPCADCKAQPRYSRANGYTSAYCLDCRRERRKNERVVHQQQLRDRLANGEVLTCYTCKVAPRHVTRTRVHDYCADCLRAYQKQYRQRAALKAKAVAP